MLPIAKIRPKRIAARGAQEILCLINDDDALWMEENDVDTKDVPDVQIQNENEVPDLPVITNIYIFLTAETEIHFCIYLRISRS